MRKLSLITRVYILATIALGIGQVLWFLKYLHTDNNSLVTLLVLFILASIAQVIKVEGTTNRSHYAISFVLYAFTLFRLGLVETMFVILVSYFAEWLWRRPAWYISAFNCASLIIVSNVAFAIYHLINHGGGYLQGWVSVAGIIASMVSFMLLNHLMVGVIVWLARGENFIQSGIFDLLPLMIDLTLLIMGGSFYLVWNFNPYAIFLFMAPIYLVYNTLRVPALERQTELDSKTGLYNNAYFMNQLENELTRAQRFNRPLSVLMADLDLLRNINNTYGHLAGDEVLLAIAKTLRASVRDYDVVARFGGEEFSVLMPETTVEVAYERAEKIRQAIEASEFTIATSVTPIKVTISIGVAGRLELNQTREEIIHNADTVLYQAKLKGRNCTVIYNDDIYQGRSSTVTQPTAAVELESQVQTAIPARRIVSSAQDNRQGTELAHPSDALPPGRDNAASAKTPAELSRIHRRTNLFIFTLSAIAVLVFALFYQPFVISNIWGLLFFALALIFTEANSTVIYVRDTAVSTSAAPLVAGALLFGPVGALFLSLVFAITTYLKFKGPKDRMFFNTANQLIPAMLFLGVARFIGIPSTQWQPLFELLFAILCMAIVYGFTTCMVSIGVSLNAGIRFKTVWIEQFSWLAPYYLAMGVMAYALMLGFTLAGFLGLAAVLIPLMVLRVGQIQYIERTRAVVSELRKKNLNVERNSDEISRMNDGLLETLADVIDLRDPYVLGHSQQVTHLAVLMAETLNYDPQRVQIIRNACLLHDLGKLGIPNEILAKPTPLSDNEYTIVKNHPVIGASLLSKNPSLKSLIPIVRHHHERFDGQGYPDGLRGNKIPIEARIVAVADAIDAMSSNRIYRPGLNREMIIAELKRNTGNQFDPQIAAIAIDLLESGKMKLANESFQS
jgi:diguanylate cyclase (GGDEF)-like protein/putative nucleotidyltransferase with HDIG domain